MVRTARTRSASSGNGALATYRGKRRFDLSPEPRGRVAPRRATLRFVVQKHAARRLHYDFRLELEGTLKSWAVPKGPSLDPTARRLAVQVEDHPIDYATFEGIIPEGEYGGGTVMIWDRGTWEPIGDARRGFEQGKLRFRLKGRRMRGEWALVRIRLGREPRQNWLLIKIDDDEARRGAEAELTEAANDSIASGRSMEQIAKARGRVWSNGRAKPGQPRTRLAAPGKPRAPTLKKRPKTVALGVDALPEARHSPQPTLMKPELATLVSAIPAGDQWLHEIKLDGYRLLCFLEGGRTRLITRGSEDWTARLPAVAAAVADLPLTHAILDGELVAPDEQGVSSFQSLQNAMRAGSRARLELHLFDVPHCEGFDLTRTPLLHRKQLLERIIGVRTSRPGAALIQYSDHVVGQGQMFFDQACRYALEGVISKRVDSPYQSRRTRDWVKTKCTNRQEFVIGGFRDPEGSRTGFGSLLLGCYDDGRLSYCGRVGTGFDEATLRTLSQRLRRLERDRSPFTPLPEQAERAGAHWVEPTLVAEVEFTQWTRDGRLRHPSFQGLREDKEPREVVREKPAVPASPGPPTAKPSARARPRPHDAPSEPAAASRIALSNPDRELYPGITKAALAAYYDTIAQRMLPHVIDRPLTLVRCPRGHEHGCFFQKHIAERLPEAVRGVTIREKSGSGRYLVIDDPDGLRALVQLGTLEIHIWGSRAADLERPDRIVFDLDPGPGVDWAAVVAAARTAREVLAAAGLVSFVQTSGGKGLHVVAPLTPSGDWEAVRGFCQAVARVMQAREPDRYIAVMTKSKRAGRIFVDYLRNGRGATSVAPYSTRARPGAPVATPLRWEELAGIDNAAAYTVTTIRRRIGALRHELWAGYFEADQRLPTAANLA